MIKLIALDMDGTLLSDHKCISKRNKNALILAASKGIQIVGATGRPFNALTQDFLDLPNTRYIISSNGAIVWDRENKEYIRRSYLSREQAILILNAIGDLRDKPVWEEMCINGKSYAPAYQFEDVEKYATDEITAHYLKTTRFPTDDIGELAMTCEEAIERVSCFSPDTEFLKHLQDKIKYIPDINPTQANERDVEIGHRETSKGQALKYLAEHLGLEPGEVMSFGDGLNDLDMIEYADYGIAVANAHQALLDAAYYVTDHNEEDGVGKAIEKFVL